MFFISLRSNFGRTGTFRNFQSKNLTVTTVPFETDQLLCSKKDSNNLKNVCYCFGVPDSSSKETMNEIRSDCDSENLIYKVIILFNSYLLTL